MVKILYSVNGDGFGHVVRSVPIIQALSKKHKVKVIVSSKRSGEFMSKHLKNVTSYEGIRYIYVKNRMSLYQSIKKNAKVVLGPSSNVRVIYNFIKSYKPKVIVTDCDFPTIMVAKFFDIPLICVCNIHAVTEMEYDVPRKYRQIKLAQRTVFKTISTNVDYHVITTFFYLPVRKKNTFLCPPILRKEIIDMKPSRKDYYLVYQTSSTNDKLIDVLKSANVKFIVYGFERDDVDKNVTFRKTNNDQFFKDLKDCKACIANGGFTFISEAVSLHKPILSIPIKGIIEQVLNALQVQKQGYGEMCDEIDKKTLLKFIKNNDKYYRNLQKHKKEDNTKTIHKVEELIDKVISKK
jgi:uncharacterized protein (TIGR00661 family)